jgi:L,D-transpeptidase YbiS
METTHTAASHASFKIFLIGLVFSIPLLIVLLLQGNRISDVFFGWKNHAASQLSPLTSNELTLAEQKSLQKKIDKTTAELRLFLPQKPYLIVNTTTNTFRLMQKDQPIRSGMCSTGSYTMLKGKKEQKWVFKTPRGMLQIRNKTKDPVWKKPDWAFIEEGLPVPSPNHPSRFDYGTLGDYSLALGDGYLIHGTLYKRFLGMSVTHGCIRMGDEDLEATFKNLQIGSKVYIY